MAIQNMPPVNGVLADRGIVTVDDPRPSVLNGRMLMPEGRKWLEVRRVVILVPETGLRSDQVQRAILGLALPDGTEITVIGLKTPGSREHRIRKNINTLQATFLRVWPVVSQQVIHDINWPSALQRVAFRNDLVVCAQEQREAIGAFRQEPLSDVLLRTLQLPVLELSGTYPLLGTRLSRTFGRLMFDLFPYGLVAVFLLMQYTIETGLGGPARTAVLSLTVVVELALIFIWSLFLD